MEWLNTEYHIKVYIQECRITLISTRTLSTTLIKYQEYHINELNKYQIITSEFTGTQILRAHESSKYQNGSTIESPDSHREINSKKQMTMTTGAEHKPRKAVPSWPRPGVSGPRWAVPGWGRVLPYCRWTALVSVLRRPTCSPEIWTPEHQLLSQLKVTHF